MSNPLEMETAEAEGSSAALRADDPSRLGHQFLASLNHDIRTPLSGIVGMTDLLLETELSEEQSEYVSTARLCADQLLEMVNSALEYASLSAGSVELQRAEFHLPRVLSSVVEEFDEKARAKNLKIEHDLATIPEYVLGDELRLRQALVPLVANAVKFTHVGGVRLAATATSEAGSRVALLAVGVTDTGIGIAADKVDAIFDSFRQLESGLSRSFAGMGLGLPIARKLAEMMGGDLSVESVPGEGSTFQLTLPLELPQAPGVESGDAASANAGRDNGGPRVLLVDDNDVARRVVTHILKRANYRIDCAEDGERGVAAASAAHYDLILMDLQMPGINGLDATTRIRQLSGYQSIPILALTANYSEEFARTCQEVGFNGFLSKPIQRTELVKEIDRRLR